MKIFIERPIATAMFFLALLVLGIYSFLNIPLELAPKEEFPELHIQTTWYGMPPEVIETEITSPLEEVTSTVKGVKKITSSSRIGSSSITVEFNPKINMEFARLALREKIRSIKNTLPYGIRPHIQPYIPEDFRTNPFLSYTISGNYSLQKLRELIKERIENGIGSIKGISSVEVTGGSDPEVKVILDNNKFKALNIHPYWVRYRIQEISGTYPAQKVSQGNQEYIFKISSSINSLRQLGETTIAYSGKNPIKLKDIAQIIPSHADVLYINRINGKPTIRLTIRKEKGASTLKVARRVKNRLEEIKKDLPSDLVFRAVDDEGEEIQKNLRELYLLVAIIFAVIFILVFLVLRNIRPSILVLSSIIFSVLITFNLIYIFKISMNLLTLGGLALGFGLFVDNSIVVFENILRLKEKGMPPIRAAIEGAREVFLPVLAATLTTISVFFSFAFFQGRLKIYYLPLAVIMTSALFASLIVSFSLIPALSPRFLKRKRREKNTRFRGVFERALKFLIRHPIEVILIITVIFVFSFRWFKAEVTQGEFFSWYSKEKLWVTVGMPPGSELLNTDAVVRKFEEKALESNYEKEINSSIMAERAWIEISFPPEIEMSYRPYLLKEELIQLATNYAGISLGIRGFDPQTYYSAFDIGPMLGSRIKFYGYNLKKLKEITSDLERSLKRNPRIKEVRIVSSRFYWGRIDSFEYVLKLNKEKLRKYTVDPLYLLSTIQTMISGRVTAPLKSKIGGKEIEIAIKNPDAEDMDLKRLLDALIMTRNGEYLRLGEISTLEERPIAGSIDRENQQFQQTVMWEFRGPYKAADRYKKVVFEKLDLPPGFSAKLEDDRFMTEEEKGQINFAIVFSIVIIFMILASLYESLIQPFFILLAVPLAMIGVFVAFVIAGFSFDSSAKIGVILLGGIVVNNSILLVDHINRKRKQGLQLLDAVIQGARERIRPIFLTTSTTVLGMLPLVLIQIEVGRKKIWSALALSTIGGLISSTIFILVAIPIFFYYGDSLRAWGQAKIAEIRKSWHSY